MGRIVFCILFTDSDIVSLVAKTCFDILKLRNDVLYSKTSYFVWKKKWSVRQFECLVAIGDFIRNKKHSSNIYFLYLIICPANILYRPDIGPILDSISARYRLPISARRRMCNSATHRADIGNRYRLPTCSRYCADIQMSSLFSLKLPIFDC